MASGADTHTHTYTNVRGRNDFKKPGARGRRPRAPGLINFANLMLEPQLKPTIVIKMLCFTRSSGFGICVKIPWYFCNIPLELQQTYLHSDGNLVAQWEVVTHCGMWYITATPFDLRCEIAT